MRYLPYRPYSFIDQAPKIPYIFGVFFKREIAPPRKKSWFLFGPRQTGKSTYVRSLLTENDLYIDLLPQREFLGYANEPGRIREEILAHSRTHVGFVCAIDEIQKIPRLLDEVHELIESRRIRFILTGSSARKLRRSNANLLAGRAYTYRLFSLTRAELGADFDLERALLVGCLPTLWASTDEEPREFLRSYTESYLREEIAQEGLTRNIAPFSRFLDTAAATDGETVNFSNVARECGVSVKTAQQYYEILEDTFLAFRLPPWRKSARKRLVAHPRYYFFDTGVTNSLAHTLGRKLNSAVRGRRFEQLVITQILAAIEYRRLDHQLFYWRTNTGAEVDLLICRGQSILAAIEIKSSRQLGKEPLDGLRSFRSENPHVPTYVLGAGVRERLLGDMATVMSWDRFIEQVLPDL